MPFRLSTFCPKVTRRLTLTSGKATSYTNMQPACWGPMMTATTQCWSWKELLLSTAGIQVQGESISDSAPATRTPFASSHKPEKIRPLAKWPLANVLCLVCASKYVLSTFNSFVHVRIRESYTSARYQTRPQGLSTRCRGGSWRPQNY